MIHRLLLLFMSAGLFAGVWAGDRTPRPGRPPAADRAAFRTSDVTVLAGRAAIPTRRAAEFGATAPCVTRAILDDPVEAPIPVVARELASGAVLVLGGRIPAPRGLAAGEYHIVSSRGDAYRAIVPATPQAAGRPDQTPAADSYVETRGTVRWHFIRIDATATPMSVMHREETPAAHETVLAWLSEAVSRLQAAVARRTAERRERLAAAARQTAAAVVDRLRSLPETSARWAGSMGESLESSLRRIERARRIAAEPLHERRL